MKAFIGHSFDDKDKTLVDTVKEFIESSGVECKTGERAQNSSIAQKVKDHTRSSKKWEDSGLS